MNWMYEKLILETYKEIASFKDSHKHTASNISNEKKSIKNKASK